MMKKTRLLCLFFAVAMVICAFPVLTFSASADNELKKSWTFNLKEDIAARTDLEMSYVILNKTAFNNTTPGWHTMENVGGVYTYLEDGRSIYTKEGFSNTRSSWHYEMGWAFKAPYTGTVDVTFQYQAATAFAGQVAVGGKGNLWISSDEENAYVRANGDITYKNALANYEPNPYTGLANGSLRTATLSVKKGVTYYFIQGSIDNADNQSFYNFPTEISYTAVSGVATSATVIGKGLATGDMILLRFFVQCNGEAVGLTAEFSIDGNVIGTDTGVDWIDPTGKYGKVVTPSDNILYFTVALSAKQLTDSVSMTVKNGSGVNILSSSVSYQAEEYCNYWINDYLETGSNLATAKVCASLLLYGRTAQQALNYHIDRLPDVNKDLLNDILANGLDGITVNFWGADLTKVPKIPQNNSLEGAMNISSNDLLGLIRNGTVAKGGLYRVADGESLAFTSSDSTKTYSLNGARIILSPAASSAGVSLNGTKRFTLKNGTLILNGGGEAVSVESAKNVTLSEIHILGNTNIGFAVSGEEITLSACSVSPNEGGVIATGVLASGNDLAVLSCNLQSLFVGVADRTATGALIENCLLTDCATGVSVETANTIVQKCTVRGGTVGIQATATKSEISAAMSERYNILVAANEIEGAQTSVLFQNLSNSVLLLNKAEKIVASGATNLYVAENTLSGELSMKNNNYLIADKNIAGSVSVANNANVNGDTLTDLSARSDVGANESLLPHINNECFVGMSRKQVRTASGLKTLGDYVKDTMTSSDVVIVPPGLYAGVAIELNDMRDKTIYAYGACHDKVQSNITALIFKDCENISCKGLYFSETTYSNSQGTITKVSKQKNTISFICDPGYFADYSDYGHFLSNSFGYVYKPGSKVPYGSVAFTRETSVRTYDPETGVNTVTAQYQPMDMIEEGDRIILRTGLGSQSLNMRRCSGMNFEDITVFSTAGFAEGDTFSDIAPVMHRYAVTYGPAPLLETGDYSKFGSLIWTDSYGRTRSAAPLTTACDAMHSTGARIGIRMISCLEEGMHDDGGNINTYYGLAVSFDSATKTLTYTNCDVNTYQLLPPDFRTGDDILLYTQDGRLIADLKVTQQTASAGEGKYTVKLSGDLDLEGKTDVIVQNASASGSGFLVDNLVVRNSAVRGLLIQTTGGEVKNSTFESLGFGGIVYKPEWTVWPEAGPMQNVSIHNNRFDSLGNVLQQNANTDGGKTAIYIIGQTKSSDLSYCLNKNIQITNNEFSGSFATRQIVLSGVQNVTVQGNTFLPRHGATDGTDNSTAIDILSGNGIVISENAFPSGMNNPVSIDSSTTKNVSGNNAS